MIHRVLASAEFFGLTGSEILLETGLIAVSGQQIGGVASLPTGGCPATARRELNGTCGRGLGELRALDDEEMNLFVAGQMEADERHHVPVPRQNAAAVAGQFAKSVRQHKIAGCAALGQELLELRHISRFEIQMVEARAQEIGHAVAVSSELARGP